MPPAMLSEERHKAIRLCFSDVAIAMSILPMALRFMVNVTSEEPGVGAGVLLRALEPLDGIEIMQRFRKTTRLRYCAWPWQPCPSSCRSTNDMTELIYVLESSLAWHANTAHRSNL